MTRIKKSKEPGLVTKIAYAVSIMAGQFRRLVDAQMEDRAKWSEPPKREARRFFHVPSTPVKEGVFDSVTPTFGGYTPGMRMYCHHGAVRLEVDCEFPERVERIELFADPYAEPISMFYTNPGDFPVSIELSGNTDFRLCSTGEPMNYRIRSHLK